MTEIKPALASESSHWYDRQGTPVYEVPRAKGDGMRPTTLRDARKLSLVPSVTTILRCAAAPGLEAWKARQLLEAALTLPKLPEESLDDYATRVIEDSKEQGRKAAERGTELHAAIELGDIGGEWGLYVEKVYDTLAQYGIDITKGKPEHSFASPLGFGGKLDWTSDDTILDFKTTKQVATKKQLAWPEHLWQLAAYDVGLHGECRARLINVFIDTEEPEVRLHEWPQEDTQKAWRIFQHLLGFWQEKNSYNGG